MESCPFCDIERDAVWSSRHLFALRDRYPVTPGHTLVVTRRHVPTWFELTGEERHELDEAVDAITASLKDTYEVDGFNVGFNAGEAAGQTVGHFHLHIIPRRTGDMADPRGGVRGVIPAKQKY